MTQRPDPPPVYPAGYRDSMWDDAYNDPDNDADCREGPGLLRRAFRLVCWAGNAIYRPLCVVAAIWFFLSLL
jgi:hypothetical protein